jgi:hypothetical protein
MQLIVYQALLPNPENIARVAAMRPQIERIGGRVHLATAQRVGMMLITVELPQGYGPEAFFPDLPFYPI